jgi:hypothetical protein
MILKIIAAIYTKPVAIKVVFENYFLASFKDYLV